ncbi:hypothetical protein HWV62_37310 [Athelia sp. TMB]|nr:hypothetical protein HWV62_37310 [Athelia sp. TMB]
MSLSLGSQLISCFAQYELVTDPDEEVYLLYTNLLSGPSEDSQTSTFHGLGHVDSRSDMLNITFELTTPILQSDPGVMKFKSRSKARSKASRAEGKGAGMGAARVVEAQLVQDKTALRSRKGDTGSVLWQASVDLAQVLLQQDHTHATDALLNKEVLTSAHVLELGAGTGLLSVVLGPLVGRYTATDIVPILPLIRKNLALNFDGWPFPSSPSSPPSELLKPGANVHVEELDWLAPPPASHTASPLVDLVLAVDCIYNPSLLPAFVSTLDRVSNVSTVVLVVMELRQEELVREFLALWIATERWEIRRVNGLLGKRYVVWVGQKDPGTGGGPNIDVSMLSLWYSDSVPQS